MFSPHTLMMLVPILTLNRNSWLDRQKKKQSHRTTICWIYWALIAFIITAIAVTFLLLKRDGIIGGHPATSGEDINEESYSTHGNGP